MHDLRSPRKQSKDCLALHVEHFLRSTIYTKEESNDDPVSGDFISVTHRRQLDSSVRQGGLLWAPIRLPIPALYSLATSGGVEAAW